jgi:hypothetical protein
MYTNQSELRFSFSLSNRPIRRKSQNLAFYMRRGKELYQALLHSLPINPGEWKHKDLILRLHELQNAHHNTEYTLASEL